jgi:hypothetical protein
MELMNSDALCQDIANVKAHLEIVRKGPLTNTQEGALDLADEVLSKIQLAAQRDGLQPPQR